MQEVTIVATGLGAAAELSSLRRYRPLLHQQAGKPPLEEPSSCSINTVLTQPDSDCSNWSCRTQQSRNLNTVVLIVTDVVENSQVCYIAVQMKLSAGLAAFQNCFKQATLAVQVPDRPPSKNCCLRRQNSSFCLILDTREKSAERKKSTSFKTKQSFLKALLTYVN